MDVYHWTDCIIIPNQIRSTMESGNRFTPQMKKIYWFVFFNYLATKYLFNGLHKRLNKETKTYLISRKVEAFSRHIHTRLEYSVDLCKKLGVLRLLKKPTKKFFEKTTLRNYSSRASEITVYGSAILLLYPLHKIVIESMNLKYQSFIQVFQEHNLRGMDDVYTDFFKDIKIMAVVAFLRLKT